MAREQRQPSGGRRRDHELNAFGHRFELALGRSAFPTKRAFLAAADIGGAQFDRYCIVGGTVPNIEQVQDWAELLRCPITDLVPHPSSRSRPAAAPSDAPDDRGNEDIERLIRDEQCTAHEAGVLRAMGGGPMRLSYFVAHAMLLEYRNAAGRAVAQKSGVRVAASRRRVSSSETKK